MMKRCACGLVAREFRALDESGLWLDCKCGSTVLLRYKNIYRFKVFRGY